MFEAGLGPVFTAIVALGLNWFVRGKLAHSRDDGRAAQRALRLGTHCVEWLGLAVYAWIIHVARWPQVVRDGFGLRDWVLIDDLATFAPFVVIELAAWAGLHGAERASRRVLGDFETPGLFRSLVLKTHLTMGLVLPVAIIFWLGQDLAKFFSTTESTRPSAQMAWMILTGGIVLILAPAFVRLSWPSSRLPGGALRTRLERLAAASATVAATSSFGTPAARSSTPP